MSIPSVLTDEKIKRIIEAIDHMNALPLEVFAFEKPMVQMLLGLKKTEQSLADEIGQLQYLKQQTEEKEEGISRLRLEKLHYGGVINSAFGEHNVDQFITRVEREWDYVQNNKAREVVES